MRVETQLVGPWWRIFPFIYKEDMVAHLDKCYDLEFQTWVYKACIPGLFSRVMVPSGTRVFPVRNPYLFLKEE